MMLRARYACYVKMLLILLDLPCCCYIRDSYAVTPCRLLCRCRRHYAASCRHLLADVDSVCQMPCWRGAHFRLITLSSLLRRRRLSSCCHAEDDALLTLC